MAQVLSGHNAAVLNKEPADFPVCNCKCVIGNCPVEGNCRVECVVYRAAITETVSGKTETYTAVSRAGNSKTDGGNTSMI